MNSDQQPTDFIEDNIDDFAQMIIDWHKNKVAMLEHMQAVPEGTEVTTDDGKTIALEGLAHAGFQLGVCVSLMELGTLPFYVNMVDAPVAADEPFPA